MAYILAVHGRVQAPMNCQTAAADRDGASDVDVGVVQVDDDDDDDSMAVVVCRPPRNRRPEVMGGFVGGIGWIGWDWMAWMAWIAWMDWMDWTGPDWMPQLDPAAKKPTRHARLTTRGTRPPGPDAIGVAWQDCEACPGHKQDATVWMML